MLLAAAMLAAVAPAANVVHLTNGKSVPVKTIRWSSAGQEYLAQPASGADVTMTFPLRDVEHLEIDVPPEIDQARKLIGDNRFTEAVGPLERVVANYKMLVWDNTAREWLARIYVQNKEPAKVVTMVEELLASGAGQTIPAGLRQKYWEALAASGQKDKVARDLDEAIATGPREAVPGAQVLRGDLRRAAGRKEEALDDYLRTVLFFQNAGPARAQALLKAAELLEDLGDPARGRELRDMLSKQYPDSDLAK